MRAIVKKIISDLTIEIDPQWTFHKMTGNRVRFAGLAPAERNQIQQCKEELQQLIKIIEKKTETYDNLILNIALAYHGRAEILDATRKIAEKVLSGELLVKNLNEQTFEKFLYTAHMENQDPELILRTSGEERLSGFLLWQSAYSELSFLDVFWPDFRFIDLLRAIRTFQKRKRRFGK